MMSKKILIFILFVTASFFLGAQFYKQEIWPFGRGYDDTLKKFVKYGFDYKNIVSWLKSFDQNIFEKNDCIQLRKMFGNGRSAKRIVQLIKEG